MRVFEPATWGLVRAAVAPRDRAPLPWPDPGDVDACRAWLDRVWTGWPGLADAIAVASPALTARVAAVLAGPQPGRDVTRATAAVGGYVLRALARPTPFGLFAGVAPARLGGPGAEVRWGGAHQALAQPDTLWLDELITGLEACPALLDRLDVVVTSLALRRGDRVEIPRGVDRLSLRCGPAVEAVLAAAAAPIAVPVLAGHVAAACGGDRGRARELVARLVGHRLLVTSLRAPGTVTDPLSYLLDRLALAGADALPETGPALAQLRRIHDALARQHEQPARSGARWRADLTEVMRGLVPDRRITLAVNLRLDAEVTLPGSVGGDLAQAAEVLLRLTRLPGGLPAWRDYHAAFAERYGVHTLVPLLDLVDPATGLGWPHGYPGSRFAEPAPAGVTGLDQALLALAWETLTGQTGEITLTPALLDRIAAAPAPLRAPPHVEMSATILAATPQALAAGDYRVLVRPARAAGTLTGRFTEVAGERAGACLGPLYRSLPTASAGALAAQLTFPPLFPHSENVSRVPAYLPHLIPLGEHRAPEDKGVIAVEDLAVFAAADRLHLVSLSRRRIVEPQVFHALALDKQPPPLARFLAHLPRAFLPGWHEFDWGPAAEALPRLPRVRHGRAVLSPARWTLTAADLPPDGDAWETRLAGWRARWDCPPLVELRAPGRNLLLDLDQPLHTRILRRHLAGHDRAVLTETAAPAEYGWLGRHAHVVAVPLTAATPPAEAADPATMPTWPGRAGHLPGAGQWLYAKIFAPPEQHTHLLTAHLPWLLARLDPGTAWWWVRYRSRHEDDHLRLRLSTPTPAQHAAYLRAVGAWAARLRDQGLASRLTLDTYYPELGRYHALAQAEALFAADSALLLPVLSHLGAAGVDAAAWTACSMLDLAAGLCGGLEEAARWMATRPAPAGPTPGRDVAAQAHGLLGPGTALDLTGWPPPIPRDLAARADAAAAYRAALPPGQALGPILDSILHMHHNRALGINPDSERGCRRLARQLALSVLARAAAP
ncbi:lantibiotic dehydratase [Bailinhaonella thermotolerans]|uniref:lantibiotic dehydratase n=1 Tax=Bailinhaonella thermotolerans TaxID=1070861 RepID=UPI00192A33AC|nr:lantibiotic dehydratase [Bailinhaonella thermotolerans]